MFSIQNGSIYVEALDLWVDSGARRPRGFISHGHADHARAHDAIVATPNTARICRQRFGDARFEERAFNEPWNEGEHRLTLFPAGHVLGSAQLMIEGGAGSFVYTGDFKLAESATCEAVEIKRCDVLLMECTYGHPQYVFPPREQVADELIAFANGALSAQAVPVFYAYSLGKAQEAMAILGRAGIPLVVHPSIEAIARVYEACGVKLPPYQRYEAGEFIGDAAVIWPPGGSGFRKGRCRRMIFTAVLTGWSVDRGTLGRYRAGRGFALSDHADYPALLRYLELAQPRKVLLIHGQREFARRLRSQGVDAEYLEAHGQLALF